MWRHRLACPMITAWPTWSWFWSIKHKSGWLWCSVGSISATHLSGSSPQFNGRLMPGWGHAGQNSANPHSQVLYLLHDRTWNASWQSSHAIGEKYASVLGSGSKVNWFKTKCGGYKRYLTHMYFIGKALSVSLRSFWRNSSPLSCIPWHQYKIDPIHWM